MQGRGRLPELPGGVLPPWVLCPCWHLDQAPWIKARRWLEHPSTHVKASTALQGRIREINYCEYHFQQIMPLSVVPNQTVIIAFKL